MIHMEGVTELVCEGVACARKVYGVEGDVVLEAPIPKEDGLHIGERDRALPCLLTYTTTTMLWDNTWTRRWQKQTASTAHSSRTLMCILALQCDQRPSAVQVGSPAHQ